MKELLMKKKENAALRTQVQQYEKLLNEVSRQMDDTEVKPELSLSRASKNEPQGIKVKSQKTETAVPDSRR